MGSYRINYYPSIKLLKRIPGATLVIIYNSPFDTIFVNLFIIIWWFFRLKDVKTVICFEIFITRSLKVTIWWRVIIFFITFFLYFLRQFLNYFVLSLLDNLYIFVTDKFRDIITCRFIMLDDINFSLTGVAILNTLFNWERFSEINLIQSFLQKRKITSKLHYFTSLIFFFFPLEFTHV